MATQMDPQETLWFANVPGQIGKLNTSTGSLYFLSEVDGYQKQYFDWFAASSQDTRGNIYFGSGTSGGLISDGTFGLTRIQPQNYSSPSTARVYFKTLKVNDNEHQTTLSADNLQELSTDVTTKILSALKQGSLTIMRRAPAASGSNWRAKTFNTIGYTSSPINRYVWKICNLDLTSS